MKPILVAGSAHLDILAKAVTRDDVMDRIGEVSIEVGGTAGNIAINLAHSGSQVRFLTAMNDSPYSKVISDYLSGHGVELYIDTRKDLPTAGFSAHVDTQGEMVSAVSSMPVERVQFDEQLVARALDCVKAVIVDCNLSNQGINRLVAIANERNIPVYVAAVSEEKSLRIGGISGSVKGIFINLREYRFFCKSIFGSSMPPGNAAKILGINLLITEGASGSTLALKDGTVRTIPPADVNEDGSRLGMGDAMAAGVVLLHEVHELSLENAALTALKLVSRVGSSEHCHHGARGALELALLKFQHEAGHDAMTGALNRHSSEQVLNGALERRHSGTYNAVSVLLLDIDHFKSINDTYGHNVGDEVIINVCNIAISCLRDTDYFGRWGGEEFIAVLPGASQHDAKMVAERIRQAIEDGIKTPRQITVSIGYCESAATATDTQALIERVDRALYTAKQNGRNQVRPAM